MRVGAGRWRGRLPVIEGIDLAGWLPGYQGSQQRGMPFTAPSTRTITGWGWGKCVGGSVLSVGCR